MDKSGAAWLYLSGALSFVIGAAFFFGLMAYMVYRAPVITINSLNSDDFVIDEALLKSLRASSIGISIVRQDEEARIGAAAKSGKTGIKELFGDINSTADPKELLLPSPPNSPASAANVADGGDLGAESRLENTDLAKFVAIDTSAAAVQNPREKKELEDRYYEMVSNMLYSNWQVVPSDLGKIARIEMRIDRGGDISYRIISAPSDQQFVDRLESALERVKAAKLEAPPRALTLNVNFEVKE